MLINFLISICHEASEYNKKYKFTKNKHRSLIKGLVLPETIDYPFKNKDYYTLVRA